MTRQSELDKAIIENCRGLKFIVLDELHTYRGRQGADVAMLMRRLRALVGDPTTRRFASELLPPWQVKAWKKIAINLSQRGIEPFRDDDLS